jgi:hypothetical protein
MCEKKEECRSNDLELGAQNDEENDRGESTLAMISTI